jgi:alpha-galactosidase
MREKIVLIGAGSASFTRGLLADLIRRGWETDLALVDTDPAALQVAEGLARKMIAAKAAPVRLSAAEDRRDVLPDATAVICTVGVGGRRAWEQDVFIPRKYGLYYPIGDTVGPGGTSRALRMIPAMVSIAEDVLDLAPKSLFFNYGNPMAANCRAMVKATGAPVVGLCHGVFGVGYYLAKALGVGRSDIHYSAVGINHLTWFVEVRARGEDAMPRLHEIAADRVAARQSSPAEASDSGTGAPDRDHPFCWHLMHQLGAFPSAGDAHVTEFFPQFFREGRYYGKTLGVDAFNFERLIAGGDRIYAQMREDALSPQPLGADYFDQFSGEHEQVLDIIEAIRTERGAVYSANLPNTGQVPNLPPEALVETPAIADGAGLRALQQRPLPTALAGTLATRFLWVETVVEAALEGSRDKLIQALVLDGAVDSLDTATRLADDLLAVHAPYLPWFAPA